MLSKRIIPALSASETHALHTQWIRSGKCYRCFHASLRQNAAGSSKAANGDSTPVNAPKRGPGRKQRAAKASEELVMLQRDIPTTSFAQSDPNTLRPAGASKTVDPEAVGENVGAGSMGDNDKITRDGPYAQGINFEVRADVDADVNSRAARSTGQPATTENASERGGSGIEDGLGESSGAHLTNSLKETPPGPVAIGEAPLKDVQAITVASTSKRAIENRLHTLLQPTLPSSERKTSDLAETLRQRLFVQFESVEEKAAVEEDLRTTGPAEKRVKKMTSLSPAARKAMLHYMVGGNYGTRRLLHGYDENEHPALNTVARASRMNSNYSHRDTEKLLEKVRSLLPKPPAPPPPAQKATK